MKEKLNALIYTDKRESDKRFVMNQLQKGKIFQTRKNKVKLKISVQIWSLIIVSETDRTHENIQDKTKNNKKKVN